MAKKKRDELFVDELPNADDEVEATVEEETEQEATVQVTQAQQQETQTVRKAPTPGTGVRKVKMKITGNVSTTGARRAQLLVSRGFAEYVD